MSENSLTLQSSFLHVEDQKCGPVIDKDDVQRYEDLGLGRGVDVTDTQMWKNKSSFQVRKICPKASNIIGTEEGGVKERYEKKVSTIALYQQKIRLSLEDPTSQVKMGLDAQSSHSTSSSKWITGTKVKTRSIAFRTDFDDIPMQVRTESDSLALQKSHHYCVGEGKQFENKLYAWILERINSREKAESVFEIQADEKIDLAKKMLNKLREIGEPDKEEIVKDCEDLVVTLGITHYISAIKLGAMQYRVFTTHAKQTQLGAGAELGGKNLVMGSLSGLSSKLWFHESDSEQEIGRIGKDGKVRKGSADEAVIGCQIQPVYKLVRIQYIQMALREAIREYIQAKEDKSVGPFHISCQINKKTVYWTVSEEHTHNILGTENRALASSFYIIPTEDAMYPVDFFIAYYGNKRETKEKLSLHEKIKRRKYKKPSLPLYLFVNSNVFGSCEGPLTLKTTVEIKHARFCLHSRVQTSFSFMMCQSTPVCWKTWLEGEQFYINCSRRSYKVDGYIAMQQNPQTEGTDYPTYKTITMPTMKDPEDNKGVGMLFRVHVPEKEKESVSTGVAALKSVYRQWTIDHESLQTFPQQQYDDCDGPSSPMNASDSTTTESLSQNVQSHSLHEKSHSKQSLTSQDHRDSSNKESSTHQTSHTASF